MRLDRRPVVAAAFACALLAGCGSQPEEPAGFADTTAAGTGTPDTAAPESQEPTATATSPEASGPAPAAAELAVDSDPPDGAEAEAFDAYVAYWEAVVDAGTVPDPDHERLLSLSTDPQQERMVSSLQDMQDGGERFTGTFRISPSVISVTGPVANLEDCTDGRDTYHIDASGAEVADSQGSLNAVDIELLAEADGWVVADVRRASDRECPTE